MVPKKMPTLGRSVSIVPEELAALARAAEFTDFPRQGFEPAGAAHVVGDKVEASYRRSDLFEKGRHHMECMGHKLCDYTQIENTALAKPKLNEGRGEFRTALVR